MEEECKPTTAYSLSTEAVAAKVLDVEEGEISDMESVEEISEEDFNKQEGGQNTVSSAASASATVAENVKVKDSNNAVNLTNNSNNSNNQKNGATSGGGGATRVWTMRDLCKYQMSRNYAPGALYNLAWAQAVQNKPLDEVLIMEYPKSDDSNNKANPNQYNSEVLVNGGESERIVIDVDDDVKEEGELEEGEIELDSEVVTNSSGDISNFENGVKDDGKPSELEKRVNLIRSGLESVVTLDDAKTSFGEVCSRLQNLSDSLHEISLVGSLCEKDKLIQLLMTAIQTVNNVFCAMNENLKEQNRDTFSRFLEHLTNQKPLLFTPQQLKEVEVMITCLESLAVSTNIDESDGEKKMDIDGGVKKIDPPVAPKIMNQDFAYLNNSDMDYVSVGSLDQNGPCLASGHSRSSLNSLKQRVVSLPLLDLHKDHDVDSLPSPTREAPTVLPIDRAFGMVHGGIKPEWPVPRGVLEVEKVPVHPYETDALKAVSSYQQKFSRTSFFMSDNLPSPTPSEDGDTGSGDVGGEVTSSFNGNSHATSALVIAQPPSSILPCTSVMVQPPASTLPSTSVVGQPPASTLPIVNLPGQGPVNAGNFFPLSSGPVPAVKPPIMKTRDPRLRLASLAASTVDINPPSLHMVKTEPTIEPILKMTNARKQKPMEEPNTDGPAFKRQRNELTDLITAKHVEAVTGTGGWLEDRGTVGLQVSNSSHLLENVGRDPRRLECVTTGTGTSAPCVTVNRSENLPMPSVPGATNSLQSLLKDRGTVGLQVSNSSHLLENVGRDPRRHECVRTSTGASAPCVTVNRNENLRMPSVPGATNSLQSLLKDIAVNPSILMNIIKMEQQKFTDSINSSTQPQSSNSIPGAVPVSNTAPPKTSDLVQKSAGILQTPPQTVTVDESTRVRMKRRDPRRVLHGINIQKAGSIGDDQNKSASSVQKQEDHPVSSHSNTTPDIGRQFIKNLKNIGDIMSAPQAAVVPLTSATQLAQAVQCRLDKGVPSESGNVGTVLTTPSEDVAVGPSRPQGNWADVEHLFEGFDDKQRAAIQKERARRIEEQGKMFASRKLCLVLDLDHTLLNSAKFVEVDPMHDEILRKKEEVDREKPQRHLFRFPHMAMWTKLRPGIWNFLEKASKLFELHLYTMGNKLYATEMAKLLDPKGELFAGRVISRGDDGEFIDGDERIPKSKDLEGVLGMESAVVIIDDSVRVWPHNKPNLIVVERYIYFPCSRRQFGLLGPSLLEIDHDERPEDGTLASSLSVIERIHQIFFAHRTLEEADVRNILAAEQRKILGGCRIVFSRVFPVGEVSPHLHPLWQTAEQFGATCTTQIDDQVTHVVANSPGTDKVNWALSTGRFVVHPGWVEASALLYRRANEHDFAIKL